jgi:E3 ubiquitin-protein ligase UBR7
MAYAHLKDKVAQFLKPFADSGEAVGAEDVKKYFEKLRGDAQGIQDAAGGAKASRKDEDEGGPDGDGRHEQSGYWYQICTVNDGSWVFWIIDELTGG